MTDNLNPQESNTESTMTNSKPKVTPFKLAIVAVLMFGFAFAMVPLYRIVCDVAGINSIDSNSGRQTVTELTTEQLKQSERVITVQFDATINGNMEWDFKPNQRIMKVKPGERATTSYFFKNNSDRTVVTQSIPGVTPWQANQHLKKMECFCFENQTLAAGESTDMGVQFVLDPNLPEDIHTFTLSYTIMDTDRSDSLKTDKDDLPSVNKSDTASHEHHHHHHGS